MNVDFNLMSELNNPKVLSLFKRILRSRILTQSELEKGDLDSKELKMALEKLQSLGLIEKKTSTFQHLNKFYPTAEGLEAEKMVK